MTQVHMIVLCVMHFMHICQINKNGGQQSASRAVSLRSGWSISTLRADFASFTSKIVLISCYLLQPPRYGLGQMVWLRGQAMSKPLQITGVVRIPEFIDHVNPQSEDDDMSQPPRWGYYFGDGSESEEEFLMDQSELLAVLVRDQDKAEDDVEEPDLFGAAAAQEATHIQWD